MKTKQVNPMPAFVGTDDRPCDFDCEFAFKYEEGPKYSYVISGAIGKIAYVKDGINYPKGSSLSAGLLCRPRLNNPQVLPDWGWLDNPLLDGFVWEVRCLVFSGAMPDDITTTVCVVEILQEESISILDLACKGVQKGSQLEDWAIENDVPIYNDDMEVVCEGE